jgi:hypothetical protein
VQVENSRGLSRGFDEAETGGMGSNGAPGAEQRSDNHWNLSLGSSRARPQFRVAIIEMRE